MHKILAIAAVAALAAGLAAHPAQAAPVCDDDQTSTDGAHKHGWGFFKPPLPRTTENGDHDHTYKNCQNAVDQLDADNAAQDSVIAGNATGVAANAAKDVEQDGRLDGHDGDIVDLEAKDAALMAKDGEQDGRLDGHDATLSDHDGRILDNEAGVAANKLWNEDQDETLGKHNTRILANLNKNVEQDGRLDAHDEQFRIVDRRLDSLDRRIDKLDDKVDEVGAITLALDNPGVDGAAAGDFAVYGASATMNGKVGFGLGLNYNVLDNFRVYAGGGTDVRANNYAGKVGAVWTFK